MISFCFSSGARGNNRGRGGGNSNKGGRGRGGRADINKFIIYHRSKRYHDRMREKKMKLLEKVKNKHGVISESVGSSPKLIETTHEVHFCFSSGARGNNRGRGGGNSNKGGSRKRRES